jgi:Zn-dependent peptidase ImmA (M78 family)
MSLDIKRLSYNKIGEVANSFLDAHQAFRILPIPIEEIAERGLNLTIAPISGMKSDYDVEGCLDSNLTTIFIDTNIYMKNEHRARFTIAHEIGHLILHNKIFRDLRISRPEDIYKLTNTITEDEYGWLEYQAYTFAGHVLVPKIELIKELNLRLPVSKDRSVRFEELIPVAPEIYDRFCVSGEVLYRRLEKEKLVDVAEHKIY